MDIKKALFFPGKYYHVYNHAIADEDLFKYQENYPYFIERLHHYLNDKVEMQAYCLMSNHYHLLIRIKEFSEDILEVDKLVLQAFSNLHNSYTKSVNKRYNRKGRLFQSTVCRKYIVDDNYLQTIIKYIRQNPVEAGLCNEPSEWPHLWVKELNEAA